MKVGLNAQIKLDLFSPPVKVGLNAQIKLDLFSPPVKVGLNAQIRDTGCNEAIGSTQNLQTDRASERPPGEHFQRRLG